jgi:hypothetical protein
MFNFLLLFFFFFFKINLHQKNKSEEKTQAYFQTWSKMSRQKVSDFHDLVNL